MDAYIPEGMAEDIRCIRRNVKEITKNTEEKENGMGDIAGLLALMQGNKGMDLPGLLALCRDKGYESSFGREFMYVFLLLFLFNRGGWGGLSGAEQAAFSKCAGDSCQSIIGVHDRIADARSVSQLGFQSLQTWLCEAIANVTNAVRNQGDRSVDATRDVGDAVRECCCKMEALMASLGCKIDGVGRDVRESMNVLNAKIELEALKAENERAAMECRLTQQQKDCCCEMNRRFDQMENLMQTNRLADENARLARENAELKSAAQGSATASEIKRFLVEHGFPSSSGSGSGTAK